MTPLRQLVENDVEYFTRVDDTQYGAPLATAASTLPVPIDYGGPYLHESVIPEFPERREPTPKDFADPRFDVLWHLLKKVDVHFANGLRSGVTGNDIAGILDRLDAAEQQPVSDDSVADPAEARADG